MGLLAWTLASSGNLLVAVQGLQAAAWGQAQWPMGHSFAQESKTQAAMTATPSLGGADSFFKLNSCPMALAWDV